MKEGILEVAKTYVKRIGGGGPPYMVARFEGLPQRTGSKMWPTMVTVGKSPCMPYQEGNAKTDIKSPYHMVD